MTEDNRKLDFCVNSRFSRKGQETEGEIERVMALGTKRDDM